MLLPKFRKTKFSGFKLFLILVVINFISGCYYDVQEELHPAVNCDASNSTYSDAVLQIITSNCYSCHDAATKSGNINLEGYANLRLMAVNGQLSGTIEYKAGFSPMPRGSAKLSDCDIAIINKWIADGSLDN